MSAKRKAPSAADPYEGAKKQAPRQDPVSCQTCRKKKLKCDRQQPCSNCQSRKISCVYANATATAVAITSASAYQHALPPIANVDSAPAANQIVATSSAHHNTTTNPAVTSGTSSTERPEAGNPRSQEVTEYERTADWLEKIMMAPRAPDALPVSIKNKLMTSTNTTFSFTNLTAFLPREAEAFALFKYYVDYVSYLYHVIIPSQVLSQINTIYQNAHNSQSLSAATQGTGSAQVNLNHLALLFSILAAASYFESVGEAVNGTSTEKRWREYTTLVAAALTQSDYMNSPTIEGLQAALIISQFVPNYGQDSSTRAIFNGGALVNQCRMMGLFQMDSARNKDCRKRLGFDPVEIEVKRRLVWSVISSDWLLSYLGGPQEGSYLIQLAHIAVDWPANIPDEDIGKANASQSLPYDVPTTMSYFIFRLKLAEFSREVTDYTGHERLQGIDVPYSKIMELDRKWNHYVKELPEYFRMDNINRRKYAQLYKDSPQIAWQRLLIQQGYHSRLCRLHRSYFIRGARDPSYSYSHIMCLRGARRVIEIKRIMDAEFPNTPSISLAWSVIHHDFMAAVILLMDVCFNWDDILAETRKQEVIEACRMLDRAQKGSRLVREAVNAMMDVLRSHWVSFSSDKFSPPPPSPSQSHHPQHPPHEIESGGEQRRIEGVSSSTAHSVYPSLDAGTGVPLSANATGDTLDLENLWSDFLDNGAMMAASPTEWMGLLSDLNGVTPALPGADATYL